jgi:RNA recognition motif-containing protein
VGRKLSTEMSVSLFVGDLGPSTDENSFFHMFQNLGAVKVRLPRDKITQNPLGVHSSVALLIQLLSSGYGFVDFPTPQEAAYVLQTYNGQPIPGIF